MANRYIVTITTRDPRQIEALRRRLARLGREVLPGVYDCRLTPAQRSRLKKNHAGAARVANVSLHPTSA